MRDTLIGLLIVGAVVGGFGGGFFWVVQLAQKGNERVTLSGTIVDVLHEERWGSPDYTTIIELESGVRVEQFGRLGKKGETIRFRVQRFKLDRYLEGSQSHADAP